MITRRNFLGSIVALPALLGAHDEMFGSTSALTAPEMSSDDLTQFVKIAIGTGGHGHTYPGATMPFGAVQLSPDTGIKDWDHCSGYHYADSSILGFSHTHLSGTGCIDMLDVLLMPATDDFKFDPRAKPDSPTC